MPVAGTWRTAIWMTQWTTLSYQFDPPSVRGKFRGVCTEDCILPQKWQCLEIRSWDAHSCWLNGTKLMSKSKNIGYLIYFLLKAYDQQLRYIVVTLFLKFWNVTYVILGTVVHLHVYTEFVIISSKSLYILGIWIVWTQPALLYS